MALYIRVNFVISFGLYRYVYNCFEPLHLNVKELMCEAFLLQTSKCDIAFIPEIYRLHRVYFIPISVVISNFQYRERFYSFDISQVKLNIFFFKQDEVKK